MHLLGVAKLVLPPWEPDQGWRVLDPDGHVVDAGGKSVAHATLDLLDSLGALDGIPLLGTGQERQRLRARDGDRHGLGVMEFAGVRPEHLLAVQAHRHAHVRHPAAREAFSSRPAGHCPRLATDNSTGSPRMTEGLAFEPADEPPGWLVTDPDGNVVAAGPQTVLAASADAGEET